MSNTLPIPLYRRILVRRDQPDEVTKNGIYLAPVDVRDTQKKSWGTVVAVNAGHLSNEGAHLPCESQAGDRVLFGKFSGTDVDFSEIAGLEHLGKLVVMPESEVLCTLPPASEG
jgi:chaperonin GroES